MIEVIAGTALLYLVQLLLPMRLKRGSEQAKRAAQAVKNLGESLPVFFTLAVLSVVLGPALSATDRLFHSRFLIKRIRNAFYIALNVL